VDIGVYMSRATLTEKLSLRHEANPETAWNLRAWPRGFRARRINRLFVAADQVWRGYFTFTHALFNPQDEVPYAILFDTRTWTPISPSPARPFRSFTYKVPPATPLSSR
jgi:hypothetical protein